MNTVLGLVLAAGLIFPLYAQPNEQDRKLVDAVTRGDSRTVSDLLGKGANPNASDEEGTTALMYAVMRGFGPIVQALLSKGANANAANEEALTALMLGAKYGRVPEMQALLKHGALARARAAGGHTPISIASTYGQTSAVRLLLASAADVNAADDEGITPLIGAAELGSVDIVRQLLAAGAAVNRRDKQGKTALMHIAGAESLRIVVRAPAEVATGVVASADSEVFVSPGEKGRQADPGPGQSLVAEARRNQTAVMRMLLGAGADASIRDNGGFTAATLATQQGNSAALAALSAGDPRPVQSSKRDTKR